jgi:hypothetical protein
MGLHATGIWLWEAGAGESRRMLERRLHPNHVGVVAPKKDEKKPVPGRAAPVSESAKSYGRV